MAPFNKKSEGFRGPSRPDSFSRGGDRPRFANKGFSGNRRGQDGDREVKMYQATCAECRKSCEVPFRPNGEKPVFCRDCFSDKRGAPPSGEYGRRDTPREFQKNDRSASSAQSFERKPQVEDRRIDELKRSVDSIAQKLEALTSMLEKMVQSSSPKVEKAPVKKSTESLAKVVTKVAKKAAKAKK